MVIRCEPSHSRCEHRISNMVNTPVICLVPLFLVTALVPQQIPSAEPLEHPGLPVRIDRTAGIAAADVDGDGDVDLFFANSTLQSNVLLLGDGEGKFVDVSTDHLPYEKASTISAVFGDVDGDGDQDLICANFNVGSQLYMNDGKGHFQAAAAANWPRVEGGDYSVVLCDVDRDGDLDVIFGASEKPKGWPGKGPWTWMRLYQNDGKGRFADKTDTTLVTSHSVVSIVMGDIDGDGDPDMVTCSGNKSRGGVPRILKNDGAGDFSDVTGAALDVESRASQCVCLADVDGDGDLDLVVGPGLNFRQPCRMYLNNGKGVFSEDERAFGRRQRGGIAIHAADLSGDGATDFIFGRFSLWQYLRQKEGGYVERQAWLEDEPLAATFLCVDVNGDGAKDLVGAGRGQNWLRFNNGKGLFKRSLLPPATKR